MPIAKRYVGNTPVERLYETFLQYTAEKHGRFAGNKDKLSARMKAAQFVIELLEDNSPTADPARAATWIEAQLKINQKELGGKENLPLQELVNALRQPHPITPVYGNPHMPPPSVGEYQGTHGMVSPVYGTPNLDQNQENYGNLQLTPEDMQTRQATPIEPDPNYGQIPNRNPNKAPTATPDNQYVSAKTPTPSPAIPNPSEGQYQGLSRPAGEQAYGMVQPPPPPVYDNPDDNQQRLSAAREQYQGSAIREQYQGAQGNTAENPSYAGMANTNAGAHAPDRSNYNTTSSALFKQRQLPTAAPTPEKQLQVKLVLLPPAVVNAIPLIKAFKANNDIQAVANNSQELSKQIDAALSQNQFSNHVQNNLKAIQSLANAIAANKPQGPAV